MRLFVYLVIGAFVSGTLPPSPESPPRKRENSTSQESPGLSNSFSGLTTEDRMSMKKPRLLPNLVLTLGLENELLLHGPPGGDHVEVGSSSSHRRASSSSSAGEEPTDGYESEELGISFDRSGEDPDGQPEWSSSGEEDEEEDLYQVLEGMYGIKEKIPVADGLVLGKFLSSGSNSVVFTGRDTVLNRKVAVKFNSESPTSVAEGSSDDIEKEYDVLQRLSPLDGIVKASHLSDALVPSPRSGRLRGAYSPPSPTVRYMVIEFLPKSLAEMAEETGLKPIPQREEFLRNFAIEALNVIEQVHRNEVVHGDIHMMAFMYTAKDNLKLIDFGKARMGNICTVLPRDGAIDEIDGSWKADDDPKLLSRHELGGFFPTWKDDLLRLGEVLFAIWNKFGYTRARNAFFRGYKTGNEDFIDERALSRIIEFKKSLSWGFLADSYGVTGPECVERFYQKIGELPTETLPDYDALRRIFSE
jgi:hypothetical protein